LSGPDFVANEETTDGGSAVSRTDATEVNSGWAVRYVMYVERALIRVVFWLTMSVLK
jgi:hypothetical protein